MNPARKVFQDIEKELALVVNQIARLDPDCSDCRQLELRRLELVDEWYLQRNICDQVKHRQESVYH